MHYQLREGLTFCSVDGRLIFLDLPQDRYFQLQPAAERSLLEWFQNPRTTAAPPQDPEIRALLEVGNDARRVRQVDVVPTVRSALELTSSVSVNPALIFELCWIIFRTRSRLKRAPLKDSIDDLQRRRAPWWTSISPSENDRAVARSVAAAQMFARGRRYVPIEPICLLDSIALLNFLSRRQLAADLVFGVTGAPFSAHCWVQSGDTILNDTLGNVMGFTPIRVV